MRNLGWIAAGVGIGAAVTYLLFSEPGAFGRAATATGYDGVEDAARKTFNWGSKSRAKGTVQSIAGAIKEGVGRVTGNDDLAGEGSVQRAVGDLRDAAGTLGHAAGQTLHDLNK